MKNEIDFNVACAIVDCSLNMYNTYKTELDQFYRTHPDYDKLTLSTGLCAILLSKEVSNYLENKKWSDFVNNKTLVYQLFDKYITNKQYFTNLSDFQ